MYVKKVPSRTMSHGTRLAFQYDGPLNPTANKVCFNYSMSKDATFQEISDIKKELQGK